MMIPDIISLNVEINKSGNIYSGVAVAEKYRNGKYLILDRYYRGLSDIDVEVAIYKDLEKVITIFEDNGALFDKCTSRAQS